MSVRVDFSPIGSVSDEVLRYVVIAARCEGRDVFCRHRLRSTWECPGGHIEAGETPLQAAKRELYEETGCTAETLDAVCVYSVSMEGGTPTYGMLFRAVLPTLATPPEDFEMAQVQLFDSPPPAWTYPAIQPLLLAHARERE